MIKVIKKKDVIKNTPAAVKLDEDTDLTEVEQEFYLASRLWNKGYRE